MDSSENTQHQFRTSVIRPPSALPRPGTSMSHSSSIHSGGLSEMSDAQNNSRTMNNNSSMIPPPSSAKVGSLVDLKRHVPQPAQISDPKRGKTLAQRAGEYPGRDAAHSTHPSTAAAAGHNAAAGASGLTRAGSVRGQTLASSSPLPLFATHTPCEPSSTFECPLHDPPRAGSDVAMELCATSVDVDVLRIAHWICVHLYRASRRALRTIICVAPRLSTLPGLLFALSLHWDHTDVHHPGLHQERQLTMIRLDSRRQLQPFQPLPPGPGPTYFRTTSGRFQLCLGSQSDNGSSRGVRLLVDAEVHQATTEACITDITDDIGDRDDMLSFRNPASNALARHNSTSSTTSRYGQNNNFSASVGPGTRQRHERSQSSLGNSRSVHAQSVSGHPRSRNANTARPRTAIGNRIEDECDGPMAQQHAWDVEGRLGELDSQFKKVQDSMNSMISDKELMDERVEMYKKRISELETERDKFADRNESLHSELNSMREQVAKLTIESETEKRSHKYELEDEARKRRHEVEQLRRELRDEVARQEKSQSEALAALERHYKVMIEDERAKQGKEIEHLRMRLGNEQQDLHLNLQKKDREVSEMRAVIEGLKGDLDREQSLKKGLEATITELSSSTHQLQGRINSLTGQVDYLQSDSKAQSDSYTQMEARLQEALEQAEFAKEKLIKEETERRILFNKYQELKGNIRVMCRVRPVLSAAEGAPAQVAYPDDKTSAEIALAGPEEMNSITGKATRKNYNFEFDRVFDPKAQNQDVFDEISQLVQSALDGYNVCIFCYGQTGSGKTHTMSSQDGMIPRATHMIYDTVNKLKEKSWTYKMEGSFIEVYNEELNDLLTEGKGRKLEIRHDDVRKQTTVVNCKSVSLDSADTVEMMLDEAQKNRSVAATKANERSSRSHSVFILKLVGFNSATGERCEGTLNLVDLAGSERLKHSQVEGDRMKETQNINKSLSCLGDVIEALGRGSGHIPYRNSKLTHLLQYSLGGNSKTLMFVMVSPLETHLKETLTSLRFATKVHNTHIGTAKATKKV
ncbi:Kinesin-like protein [Colletotrichum fructicola]|nr:Kinesin-like protein [Colletotrichum fructicola]KAE9583472.1 Kinesin-like protein [Colletotrichum fructicola]